MIKVSHKKYKNDIESLAQKIKNSGKKYSGIYGIPRGGTYPAAMLSQILGIQQIFDPMDIRPETLIVDDLIDSGNTLSGYASNKAVVYARSKKKTDVDYYGCVIDDWIIFPDESGAGIEENFKRTLQYIGEDITREGLLETPKRMRKAYDEIFSGYKTDPKELMKTFQEGSCEEMVILKNCEFFSTCEHHFFPFFGHISIGYLPNKKVIGISKLARLVDCFSKRMQIQERMTAQIADIIMQELDARGVFVVCEGVHFCMTSRGIRKQDTSMVTSAVRGTFKDDAMARAEFLQLIKE
jgi:GTP cyclohydrolase I